MFLNFDHTVVDFTEDEWESVSRVDKTIIREWFLNGRDNDQTMLSLYYETDKSIWKTVKGYDLKKRAQDKHHLAPFTFFQSNLAV